jgi:3-oxoacyl-[acyl-carrier-protein] synthase II
MTSTAACASGHYSIIEAFHYLQRGEADVMIAGGTESALSLLIMAAFGRMGPLSKSTENPETACRPFSVDRDGFVSGEGACALILETEEHARKRGARIYGEVLGGSLTGDAFHITAPDPTGDGAARALENAVRFSGLTPDDIGLVYAHGTGTALNDVGEALALRRAFGEHIYDMQITSIKSMVGHALGAAGAQSAVAAVQSLREGVVPPTINYTPDPEIDIPIFGGQNVVAIFGKVDE